MDSKKLREPQLFLRNFSIISAEIPVDKTVDKSVDKTVEKGLKPNRLHRKESEKKE